jgi:transposase
VDDYIAQDNPVRVIDAFVEELDLAELVFSGTMPALTGRPSYHPGVMLKIYIYGYPNRVPSSRHLERECQRNEELMWLTARLAQISRPSPTFVATMARPFATYAAAPSNCVED